MTEPDRPADDGPPIDPEVQYHLDRIDPEKTPRLNEFHRVASRMWLRERGHIAGGGASAAPARPDPSVGVAQETASAANSTTPGEHPGYHRVSSAAPFVHGLGRAYARNAKRDVTSKPITWLWDKRVPLGELSAVLGSSGAGKTYVSLDLAAKVTTGGQMCDGARVPQGRVIIMNGDNSAEHVLKPRLEKLGADVERVEFFTEINTVDKRLIPFVLKKHAPVLEDLLWKLKDVRLVLLDPVMCFMDGTDMNAANEVREAMRVYQKLTAAYETAMLFVHHHGKTERSNALDRGLSSVAFGAAWQIVWSITPHPHDPTRQVMTWNKSNISPRTPGLAFQIDEKTERIAWSKEPVEWTANQVNDMLRNPVRKPDEGAHGPRRDEREQVLEFILKQIAGKAVTRAAVWREAEKAGFDSKATFARAVTLGKLRKQLVCEPVKPGGRPWLKRTPQLNGTPSKNGTQHGLPGVGE